MTSAALLTAVAAAASGCGTSRISRLQTHGDVNAYASYVGDDILAVGVHVEDRPGDERFWLNAAFRNRNLLVLSAKLRNTGRDRLLVRRRDLVVTTPAGRELVPLSPVQAVDRAKGFLGIYRPLSFGTIHYGYDLYALPELVILEPNEEVAGYLYFGVKKRHEEDARRGRLRVRFVRFDPIGESEYGVPLQN